jgi:hypothetical protein
VDYWTNYFGEDEDDDDFMPTMSWPDAQTVDLDELFGDEDSLVRSSVEIVTVPPVGLRHLDRCEEKMYK